MNQKQRIENSGSSALNHLGQRIEDVGDSLRSKVPDTGRVHDAAEAVAKRMENAGHYLQDKNLRGLAKDATDLVRTHPIPFVFIGLGIGYLIARRRR